MAKNPVDQFVEWLETQISEKPPGFRLPSDAEIAVAWNISQRTVRRLTQPYRDQGKIQRIQGKGTFIGGADPVESQASFSDGRTSAQNLADLVYKSICNGEFKRGEPLPSVKFMANQFSLAPRTVIQAYRILQKDEHIQKIGKNFWVGQFSSLARGKAGKTVYIFCDSSIDYTQIYHEDMLALSYLKMENELSAYGYVVIHKRIGSFQELTREWLSQKKFPYGLVFYDVDNKWLDRLVPRLKEFLKEAEEFKLGIVIDFGGELVDRSSWLNVISRSNISTVVARTVAQYAVNAGFDKIDLFYDESVPYSRITGQFWSFFTIMKIRTEIMHLNRDTRFRLIIKPVNKRISLANYVRKRRQELPPQVMDGILSKYKKTSFESVAHEISLANRIQNAYRYPGKNNLLLFTSHKQAVELNGWAQDTGFRIPGDLSILSLERNPRYYHHGISFCEADWEGMGYLMAHSIINDIPIQRTTKGFVRINAYVRDKLTT